MTQLLQNAAYGTAMILAVVFLRRVLKGRLVPGARLALWAVCLFRLLTPAAPESVLSLWGMGRWFAGETQSVPTPAPAPAVPNGGGGFIPATPGMTAPAVPAPQPTPEVPWETILLALWAAVGLALAVRYVLSWRRTRRAVSCAIPVGRDDPRYLPLPKCARLREGPMDGAPLTFGAVKPTVVLSPGLDGAELECVLAHEGVHARRRDNLWHYVMALALMVHWWNPAVWLMARLLRRDVELSCDRAALKKLGAARRADYANALVSMATQAEGPAFCQTFGRKAAEERIISIMKYKKTTIAGAALTLALVLAVTVGFASNPVTDNKNGDAFYKDEDGSLVKIAPENIVSGFIFPARSSGTVEFGGRVYTRDDLSPETLDWLDWYLALSEEEQLAISYVPAELNQGRDPETQEAGDYASADTRRMSIDEYKALLDGLVAGGKMSQEDADWFYAGAKQALDAADANGQGDIVVLKANETGSYAIMTVPPCNRPDCGNLEVHQHNGVTYSGWIPGWPAYEEENSETFGNYTIVDIDENGYPVDENGNHLMFDENGELFMKFTVGYGPCIKEDCTVSGEHHHENGEVIHHYATQPAELDNLCGLPLAPTNGPEDSAGMCNLPLAPDGSNDEPIACPPQAIDLSFGPHTCADCGVEGCTVDYLHHHAGGYTFEMGPVCPYEDCTLWGSHDHDGVMYSCNGHAHQGGVCDGTCYSYNEPSRTNCYPDSTTHHSESHHSESRHTSGHHGNHH